MDIGPFLGLPAELRLRIYGQALQCGRTLQKPLRETPWQKSKGSLVDISLLCVCKTLHAEARDVFYEINSFSVSYNHICYCENRYPYRALHDRIGSVTVTNFVPREEEGHTCEFCLSEGYGLLAHLRRLPKLTQAKVSFEDVFSFTDYAPGILSRLTENEDVHLSSEEIGQIDVVGLPLSLRIELPILHRAWSSLAFSRGRSGTGQRLPGEQIVRRTLEYMQFETNTYDRTARSLLPFFTASQEGGTRSLRFRGLPDGPQRRAEFTIALAGVLYDVFADDGGSESIDWTDVPGSGTWTFFVDNYTITQNAHQDTG
ncbi:hypothetical protein LTR78_005537 [Recurvomyces mirabilis]|uniref:Uncharacterized protein n=1 Tax=Recurvomyces mirabilis TaxID=574656 RepID=A0AAE0WMF7_9PEZI|nr:hypothetical protein LTR78_005537 [Recurvomyces mirabilis]KAK5158472.1 hypothetical protein LTS14_003491 [Recurvomyces mirabilis]